MSYSTTVGVDLAKNVIQISVVSDRGKELCNRSLTRKKFAEFLAYAKPVAHCVRSLRERALLGARREAAWACSSDYSGQGRCPVSQGQKTDSNDALSCCRSRPSTEHQRCANEDG